MLHSNDGYMYDGFVSDIWNSESIFGGGEDDEEDEGDAEEEDAEEANIGGGVPV